MKIGSHIKPRSGKPRHVTIHDTEYAFAPVKDNQGVTHFMADVTNADHAALLLENGAFYAFDKAAQVKPKLTRASAGDTPPPPADPVPTEIETEAKALLDNTVDALGVAVGKVSSLDVVRCALQLEHAGSARKSAISLLETTLAAANEAGVKG